MEPLAGEGGAGPVRVLRLQRTNRALTAQVFEENFLEALGGAVEMTSRTAPASWPDFFAALDGREDFLAPNYELQPLVPWLLSLRNDLNRKIRLLFVAHAPGGMAWIWRLLVPLLRPGDRIVAPSGHAASVIVWLEPRLEPFVRVVGHPIPGPSRPERGGSPSFLFLGRIRPEKCLHQLIDGYALFRRRRTGPPLVIAGPLDDDDDGRPLVYVTALRRRAARLGLEEEVLFPGPLRGEEKETALAGALGLCNLSLSLEESFGKAPAEALVRGLPVLATSWSAFPELLGSRGVFVPCRRRAWGGLSVDAEDVASGLEALMALGRREPLGAGKNPFEPVAVGETYRRLLVEAREERTLPPVSRRRGVLDETAPLNAMTRAELFGLHLEECRRRLRRMAGDDVPAYGAAERIQGVLALALHEGLTALFAGGEAGAPAGRDLALTLAGGESPLSRAASRGYAVDASRLACVAALAEEDRPAEARRLLEALPKEPEDLRAFAAVRLALKENEGRSALDAWLGRPGDWLLREEGGPWLCLGAEIARAFGGSVAQGILPVLGEWCRRFPDGPESGAVALGWCLAALACDALAEGREALTLARALLPDGELLLRLDSVLLGVC